MDRASEEEDNLDDLLVLSNHLIKALLLVVFSCALIPVVKGLAATENCSCCFINGFLDLLERRVELDLLA